MSTYRLLLEKKVDDFVAQFANRSAQRTDDWHAMRARIVGGSELAAIMGTNPYSSTAQVVAQKAGVEARSSGGVACHWGTFFEDVIEKCVEIDCGARLAGTTINIPAPAPLRHANSPDGYAVVEMYFDPEAGEWQLLTTDEETQDAAWALPRWLVPVLVEFKCPYRRRPKGDIPAHYQPQVWSGLALSPVVSRGLFVDATFRRCSLGQAGPGPYYDRAYHREKINPDWETPVAHGFAGVYAEDLAPAADLYYRAFGTREVGAYGPIDFGTCAGSVFDDALAFLDGKKFRAVHAEPRFADGRGAGPGNGREALAFFAQKNSSGAPLVGIIPWKLFSVHYTFVDRRPDFLDEIAPLVDQCLDAVSRVRSAEDPAAEYARLYPDARAQKSCDAGRSAAAFAADDALPCEHSAADVFAC